MVKLAPGCSFLGEPRAGSNGHDRFWTAKTRRIRKTGEEFLARIQPKRFSATDLFRFRRRVLKRRRRSSGGSKQSLHSAERGRVGLLSPSHGGRFSSQFIKMGGMVLKWSMSPQSGEAGRWKMLGFPRAGRSKAPTDHFYHLCFLYTVYAFLQTMPLKAGMEEVST